MKRIIFMIFLCMALMAGYAQRLSHTFDKASFSKVLVWLDKAQPQYKINFIYDELEDFTVSTSFKNKDVRDIVTQIIGFYPIRATFDKDEIYFECVQKEPQKLIGKMLSIRLLRIRRRKLNLKSGMMSPQLRRLWKGAIRGDQAFQYISMVMVERKFV